MADDIQYVHNFLHRKWLQFHWRWRGWFGRSKFYLPIAKWRHGSFYLNDDTEIVIEGFPRSGNTFAMTAFEFAQQRECTISSHIHASSVVKQAIEKGIPVIILVRDPVDAAISFEIMMEHSVPASQAMSNYTRFYKDLLPYADSVVVASFETATSDFGRVVDAVNEKYGTNFLRFDHTPENVDSCFSIIDKEYKNWRGTVSELFVSRPSESRRLARDRIRETLASKEVATVRARANIVYRELRKEAV